MTQTGSNVGCTRGDAITVGGSRQVRSPNVVRGKGKPPSLRRASRMEKEMRKVKAKAKKTPEKGKRKERDEGDAPILNTQRSLFGHSEMDIAGHVQGRPGFLVVLEYLNVASTLQKQCGGSKVRFANDEEDIDDDNDDDDILT
ncbi:hypothetical protein Q3G72_012010 [Acer saccharum]|nr:hypothetical protein Q3G72_012010 [Acer saccharum]